MILVWRPLAEDDRVRTLEFIGAENPQAAIELDDLFEKKAEQLIEHPKLYKPGRVKGTRDAVVHPNYVMVYMLDETTISILRILHAAQLPPKTMKTLMKAK